MVQSFAFNHAEATRCFRRGLRFDKTCVMLHWGIAYANGPNYNSNGDLEDGKQALGASLTAGTLAASLPSRSLDRALASAMARRYTRGESGSIECDPRRWTASTRRLYDKFPDDSNVALLHAEAMMLEAPWHLWDASEPRARAETAQRVLERALESDPDHPGLLHMYIHLIELSSDKYQAKDAATKLLHTVPDAGHLVHMGSHILMSIGDYSRAVLSNQKAVAADIKTTLLTGVRGGMFRLYRCHNYHFLAWAAMMDGRYQEAQDAARSLEQIIMRDVKPEEGEIWTILEPFLAIRAHVLIRFGKWDSVLALAAYPSVELAPNDGGTSPKLMDIHPTANSTRLYARAVAFAAKGRVAEARVEHKALVEALASGKLDGYRIFNNKISGVERGQGAVAASLPPGQRPGILDVGAALAIAEIEYRAAVQAKDSKKIESAFALLSRAVQMEDTLAYDEPWGWMVPTRHALGALLLEQRRFHEAIETLREDLGEIRPPRGWDVKRQGVFHNYHPNNLWALQGLLRAYQGLHDASAVKKIKIRLSVAAQRWNDGRETRPRRTDEFKTGDSVPLNASTNPTCYCATQIVEQSSETNKNVLAETAADPLSVGVSAGSSQVAQS